MQISEGRTHRQEKRECKSPEAGGCLTGWSKKRTSAVEWRRKRGAIGDEVRVAVRGHFAFSSESDGKPLVRFKRITLVLHRE